MIQIAKPLIGEEEKKAVREVLESGRIAQGPVVAEFERSFSGYVGCRHGIATSSGTAALHLALLACGVRPGDEVITTPFSFIATANSILYCGARPVFADIDEMTFNIDPERVREKITGRTKALLVVHLYGQPCRMDELLELCREHDLRLIEDACQAHGAVYKGRRAGSLGDCGVFSFYPTKNMTTGEGGMITTSDPGIAEKARLLREHGSRKRYHHETLGYNYRMTDMAAAIGVVQLKRLEGFNKKRIENAARLTEVVEKIPELKPPHVMDDILHVYHQYTIRATGGFRMTRDEVARRLWKRGVGTGIYYPVPIHRQPVYQGLEASLPVSEKLSKEVLSLPVHPGLRDEELELICKALQEL